jgi:hypothetical protein
MTNYLLIIQQNAVSKKHFTWYKNIIQRGANEQILRQSLQQDGDYYEKHHILPRSMCTDSCQIKDTLNIVLLTAREHLIAHRILCYILPQNRKIIQAYYAMFKCRTKMQHSFIMKSRDVEFFRKNSRTFLSRKGKDNGMWGRKHTPEAKAIISAANQNKTFSAEQREGCRQRMTARMKATPIEWTIEKRAALSHAIKKSPNKRSGKNHPGTKRFCLTSPSGETFFVDDGLAKFCKDKNLSRTKLLRYAGITVPLLKNSKGNQSTEASLNVIGWKLEVVQSEVIVCSSSPSSS